MLNHSPQELPQAGSWLLSWDASPERARGVSPAVLLVPSLHLFPGSSSWGLLLSVQLGQSCCHNPRDRPSGKQLPLGFQWCTQGQVCQWIHERPSRVSWFQAGVCMSPGWLIGTSGWAAKSTCTWRHSALLLVTQLRRYELTLEANTCTEAGMVGNHEYHNVFSLPGPSRHGD